MVHGGVCLAHLDGGTTLFVDGGIPGERAQVELSYRKRTVWFGKVVGVDQPSSHRVAAPCPYVGTCGGCQLQHVSYEHHLELKRGIVEDAMRRQHVPLPDEIYVHGMEDPWRYRWRGEFHVVPGPNGAKDAGLGFNRVRSWRPVAVDDCLIHHRTISAALPSLLEAVHRGGDDRLTSLHLTVGEGGDELMVRAKPQKMLDGDAVDSVAMEHGLRWLRDSTTLHWRGFSYRVTPDTFIQVNWSSLDTLYGIVLDRLGDVSGKRIVDGYAGIGVVSCVIARHAAEVICIENNPASCRMGMLNARLNEVDDRLRYVVAPVEEALPGVFAGSKVDALVLDPARAGCESEVCGFLALAGPKQIVYVSCDPATLARDLRVLVSSWPYIIETMDIVDIFPHTHHVECVVALRRIP